MSIILSQSLVRKLSLSYENLIARDTFTQRDTPEDKRTFEHKSAINARARNGFAFALIDCINAIYANHGIEQNDSTVDLFRQYRVAADELTASRKREMKRKHDAKLERQREREAEQLEVAALIAA